MENIQIKTNKEFGGLFPESTLELPQLRFCLQIRTESNRWWIRAVVSMCIWKRIIGIRIPSISRRKSTGQESAHFDRFGILLKLSENCHILLLGDCPSRLWLCFMFSVFEPETKMKRDETLVFIVETKTKREETSSVFVTIIKVKNKVV